MKVKLLTGKNAGEEVTVSNRWALYALSAGLASLPDKKTKPAEKPATDKED